MKKTLVSKIKSRPRQIALLSACLFLLSVYRPTEVMAVYGMNLVGEPSDISMFFLSIRVLFAAGLLCSYMVIRLTPWVLMATPALLLAVMWNTWLAAGLGLDLSIFSGFVMTGMILTLHSAMLASNTRRYLTDPNTRYWLTAPRKPVSLPAIVWPALGGELICTTWDISHGGAFISFDEAIWAPAAAAPLRNLEAGTRCTIRLGLDQAKVIHCMAEVIRQSAPNGRYPSGFAIRFVDLDDSEIDILTAYIQSPDKAPVPALAAAVPLAA